MKINKYDISRILFVISATISFAFGIFSNNFLFILLGFAIATASSLILNILQSYNKKEVEE